MPEPDILDDLPAIITDDDLGSARADGESVGYRRGFDQGQVTVLPELFRLTVQLEASQRGATQLADLASDWLVAMRVLGFRDIPVDETGRPDPVSIREAVEHVMETKPYLAAPPAQRPAGSKPANQGPTSSDRGYITRADLQTMTPEEIVAAKDSGQLDSLLEGSTS